jgi:hypothetical protein
VQLFREDNERPKEPRIERQDVPALATRGRRRTRARGPSPSVAARRS